jgi:hypothetical protein
MIYQHIWRDNQHIGDLYRKLRIAGGKKVVNVTIRRIGVG